MSTSRDNLPAVEEQNAGSTGDRLAVAPIIEERTRKTLADVRWLLVLGAGSIVAVFGGGWAAFAQVRTEATETAKAEVRPALEEQKRQAAELAAVKAKAEEQDRRMANVERMTVETNATLKLVAMRLGVTPITLEQGKDGGQ